METETYQLLEQGFAAAFINRNISSNLAYKPQFVSNDYRQGKKVLSSIEDELFSCDEFAISVAFITRGGITPLLQTLKELEKRGIPGRILTTDYLNFSEPKAMETLAGLKNITLKMYVTEEAREGFHTKGYIFKKEELYRIIIGSSNMTQSALTTNREWNTKIVSAEQGEYTQDVLAEFEQLWDSSYALPYEKFIDQYSESYVRNKVIRKQKEIARKQEVVRLEEFTLQPNFMQVGFIANLQKLREYGEEKALLISATGTGKTYASAFALREENPEKVLFLVHREQIAKQAIRSYKKVFGNTKSFGLLSGNSKEYDAEYLFSTMNMMARPEVHERFSPDEFQVIVIDEAHRTGAGSYQEIMKYFKPKFWLGMTASPERTDDFDVFEAFDHNIAYKIRLQQAMEENLPEGDWYYFILTNNNFAFGQDWMCSFDFDIEQTEDVMDRSADFMEQIAGEQRTEEKQYGTGELVFPEWSWPTVSRKVSGLYGIRENGTHSDHINIAGTAGDEIYAVADGVVLEAAFESSSGNFIVVDLGDGVSVKYGYLKEIKVSEGEEIKKGQVIATMGQTGTATGPNLLFAVSINGEEINPFVE